MYGDIVWKKGSLTVTTYYNSWYLYIEGKDHAIATKYRADGNPSIWAMKKIRTQVVKGEEETAKYQSLVDQAKEKTDMWKQASKEID